MSKEVNIDDDSVGSTEILSIIELCHKHNITLKNYTRTPILYFNPLNTSIVPLCIDLNWEISNESYQKTAFCQFKKALELVDEICSKTVTSKAIKDVYAPWHAFHRKIFVDIALLQTLEIKNKLLHAIAPFAKHGLDMLDKAGNITTTEEFFNAYIAPHIKESTSNDNYYKQKVYRPAPSKKSLGLFREFNEVYLKLCKADAEGESTLLNIIDDVIAGNYENAYDTRSQHYILYIMQSEPNELLKLENLDPKDVMYKPYDINHYIPYLDSEFDNYV